MCHFTVQSLSNKTKPNQSQGSEPGTCFFQNTEEKFMVCLRATFQSRLSMSKSWLEESEGITGCLNSYKDFHFNGSWKLWTQVSGSWSTKRLFLSLPYNRKTISPSLQSHLSQLLIVTQPQALSQKGAFSSLVQVCTGFLGATHINISTAAFNLQSP